MVGTLLVVVGAVMGFGSALCAVLGLLAIGLVSDRHVEGHVALG
jgi:hypothetical protein